jgi:paraquat-inducible protein A
MTTLVATTAAARGLARCGACGLLVRCGVHDEGTCPRCGAPLRQRRARSIETTWALLLAAAVCYVPANLLPVLVTDTPGSSDADTILGGVVFLATSGSWPLALIVLVASVMVPLGKLLALSWLLLCV